jgi:sterol desaturase/sphingolipid hydroxylase (fatty acid hydroxylase superfamily)
MKTKKLQPISVSLLEGLLISAVNYAFLFFVGFLYQYEPTVFLQQYSSAVLLTTIFLQFVIIFSIRRLFNYLQERKAN